MVFFPGAGNKIQMRQRKQQQIQMFICCFRWLGATPETRKKLVGSFLPPAAGNSEGGSTGSKQNLRLVAVCPAIGKILECATGNIRKQPLQSSGRLWQYFGCSRGVGVALRDFGLFGCPGRLWRAAGSTWRLREAVASPGLLRVAQRCIAIGVPHAVIVQHKDKSRCAFVCETSAFK